MQSPEAAKNFDTTGWQIRVEGMVHKPRSFTIPQLKEVGPIEERIYRMRCVEAWSMGDPVGRPATFPSHRCRRTNGRCQVRPPLKRSMIPSECLAKRLRFEVALRRGTTFGRSHAPSNASGRGALRQRTTRSRWCACPIGYTLEVWLQRIKSIVKITLVSDEPPSSWKRFAPSEYGFLANVNPNVPHPRWSQATEQRIGESRSKKDSLVQTDMKARSHLSTKGSIFRSTSKRTRSIR